MSGLGVDMGTYFGITPLSSVSHLGALIQGRYSLHERSQSRGLLIDSNGLSSRLIDVNSTTGDVTNIFRQNDLPATASKILALNKPAVTAIFIFGPRSYGSGDLNNPAAGKITCQVYNSVITKCSVYEMLYQRRSSISACIKLIDELEDHTITYDTSAFTFQVLLI